MILGLVCESEGNTLTLRSINYIFLHYFSNRLHNLLKLLFKRDLVFAKSIYNCSFSTVNAIFTFSVFASLYNLIINCKYEQNVMGNIG